MSPETEAIARAVEVDGLTIEWLHRSAAINGVLFNRLHAAFVVEGAAALASEKTSPMGLMSRARELIASDRQAVMNAALADLRSEMHQDRIRDDEQKDG